MNEELIIEEERKNQYLEEEMEVYNLTEEEKILVRNGEYDPWDFDIDNPSEDDDYYKEDYDYQED